MRYAFFQQREQIHGVGIWKYGISLNGYNIETKEGIFKLVGNLLGTRNGISPR